MQFSLFAPFHERLLHLVTNRHGGVSEAPYATLNLALHVGDDPAKVVQNRLRLAERAGFDAKNLIYMDQVHGAHIAEITHPFENKIERCDALITDRSDIALMVMVADCLPLLFFDPVRSVIAVAHAGRNGTFLRIGAKVVERMCDRYGSRSEEILVAIGPGIHRCCYEVGPEIADIVTQEFGAHYLQEREGRMFLDLVGMNVDQLRAAGVAPEHIEASGICSCCDREYFSYRREGRTGRFAGVMMLKGAFCGQEA